MKVAIIGSGVSGLTCLKTCLQYGFEATCFEKSNDIGGLWRYKPHECDGEASVMKSTVINTSKEMMAFSDFPPPDNFAIYMHNRKVLEYTCMYADHFGLLPHIQFQTEVVQVSKSEQFTTNGGQWNVTFKKHKSQVPETTTFDAVFLCTGHHVDPYRPELEGLSNFKGRVIHSHSYKDHVGYEDKRVVLLGIGNSGGDISVELARICSQVYISTRSGNWCNNRISIFGLPLEMLFGCRVFVWMKKYLGVWFTNTLMEYMCNFRFNHSWYGMQCRHRWSSQHPMVNDDFANRIIAGQVVIKPNIRKFHANRSIEFDDRSIINNVDVLILCTGYNIGFPLLSNDIIGVDDNKIDTLYKNVFPTTIEHDTLFIIGLIQPIGAVAPMSEMQCRVCCEVLIGNVKLPDKKTMKTMTQNDNELVYNLYTKSRRHTIQVDYVPYMEDLAEMIGARPSVWKYFFTDPQLWINFIFGPAAPYQFRIEGPHRWDQAIETQKRVWIRTIDGLKKNHRQVQIKLTKMQSASKFLENMLICFAIICFCLMSIVYYSFFIQYA